jgi:hypothetical protein
MCDEAGLETHWLSPEEATSKWPGLDFGKRWGPIGGDGYRDFAPPVHLEPTGPDPRVGLPNGISSDSGRANRVYSVLWCPTDGYLQPYDLGMTFLARAKKAGAQFATDTAVCGVRVDNGASSPSKAERGSATRSRVVAVETNRGVVECDRVINAAGAHAYHVAKLAMPSIAMPIFPVRHTSVSTRTRARTHTHKHPRVA